MTASVGPGLLPHAPPLLQESPNPVQAGQAAGLRRFSWRPPGETVWRRVTLLHSDPPHCAHLDQTGPRRPGPGRGPQCPSSPWPSSRTLVCPLIPRVPMGPRAAGRQTPPESPWNASSCCSSSERHTGRVLTFPWGAGGHQPIQATPGRPLVRPEPRATAHSPPSGPPTGRETLPSVVGWIAWSPKKVCPCPNRWCP